MRWGLIPSWAKEAAVGNKLANARGETVAEKPSFKHAFNSRRCIIPVSGFYEWKTEKGVKYPWFISLSISASVSGCCSSMCGASDPLLSQLYRV